MLPPLVHALGAAVILGAFLSDVALIEDADPTTSTWDNFLGASPKNRKSAIIGSVHELYFDGILRDDLNRPIPNFPASQMVLDFTACTNADTRPTDFLNPDADSDADGRVEWRKALNWGGGDPCEVKVLIQNVIFKILLADGNFPAGAGIDGGVRNMDENGVDGVTTSDLGIWHVEFSNTGTRHDFRGDLFPQGTGSGFNGAATTIDLASWRAHFIASGPDG